MSHFSDNAYNVFEYKEKRMTTHSSILGEFSGQRSLLSCIHGVTKSWTQLRD